MSRRSYEANRRTEGQLEIDKKYTVKQYTPDNLVKDLLGLIKFDKSDFVIDAGSGINKVWYNNIPIENKEEFEIEEGKDFYKFDGKCDWVVGNPPFPEIIGFIFKSIEICNKGFAFLINHSRLNQITPSRLKRIEEKGFKLNIIQIVAIKAWFGRYYFLVFSKDTTQKIGYNSKTYS